MGSENSGALARSGSCQEGGERDRNEGRSTLSPLLTYPIGGSVEILALPKNGIRAVQFRYHHFEKSLLFSFVAHNPILFDICSRGMQLAQESL